MFHRQKHIRTILPLERLLDVVDDGEETRVRVPAEGKSVVAPLDVVEHVGEVGGVEEASVEAVAGGWGWAAEGTADGDEAGGGRGGGWRA